jgi:hypothetical protein
MWKRRNIRKQQKTVVADVIKIRRKSHREIRYGPTHVSDTIMPKPYLLEPCFILMQRLAWHFTNITHPLSCICKSTNTKLRCAWITKKSRSTSSLLHVYDLGLKKRTSWPFLQTVFLYRLDQLLGGLHSFNLSAAMLNFINMTGNYIVWTLLIP